MSQHKDETRSSHFLSLRSSPLVSRRSLLKAGVCTGGGLLLGALPGCSGPVQTLPNRALGKLPKGEAGYVHFGWHPKSKSEMTVSAARELVAQIVPAISDNLSWFSKGDSVLLKVASNTVNVHPAITWPNAVEAVASYFKDLGARTVLVGDQAGVETVRLTRDGRVFATQKAFAENGLGSAIKNSRAKTVCFDDLGWEGYAAVSPDFESLWGNSCYLTNALQNVDHVIYLPRIGTHGIAGYSGAIKNAVGWLRDDSRRMMHLRGDKLFELYAEVNHMPILRDKLRFALSIGHSAMLNIGPDFGGEYDFKGIYAIGSRQLVDHDLLCASMVPWLNDHDCSIYDLVEIYPKRADYFNRRLCKNIWGKSSLNEYRPLVPTERTRGLLYDRAISHLALLQKRRPRNIKVHLAGGGHPASLLKFLKAFDNGIFNI